MSIIYLGPYFKCRYYKQDFLYTKRICITQHCPLLGLEQKDNKYCPACGLRIDDVEFLINKSSINPFTVQEQLNSITYADLELPEHHIYMPTAQRKNQPRDFYFNLAQQPSFEILLSDTNRFMDNDVDWLANKFSSEYTNLVNIYEAYPAKDNGNQVHVEWGLLHVATLTN